MNMNMLANEVNILLNKGHYKRIKLFWEGVVYGVLQSVIAFEGGKVLREP